MKTVFLLLSFLCCNNLFGQQVTTYIGTDSHGTTGDGGLAVSARSYLPMGLNLDNSGNLLVCQRLLIRKIDNTTKIVTSIAGSDTATSLGGGGNGGPATCALLVEPYGICLDKQGNYYIADYWTPGIRKVNAPSGIIDIYAGTSIGNTGDGGPAMAAKFGAGVTALCIDTARNYLYISDAWNYRVRRIDIATGIISAFAGTSTNAFSGDGGPATAAKFSRVFGLAIDKAGNVYIGDWDNHRIRKVSIEGGIVTTIAGNGTDGFGGDGGPATAAMLKKPTAICFDTCGNLYFSDEDNNRVRRINAETGIISTVAGNGTPGFSGDGGSAIAAQFNHPTGVCIDKNFNLYVGDYYNHRVRKIALGNCEGTGTSVGDIIAEQQAVTISPNPATTHLSITSGTAISTVVITNMLGQSFYRHTMVKATEKAELDISHLPPGMYLIRVNDKWVQRFMKE